MIKHVKKLITSAAVAGALVFNLGGIAVAQSWEDDPYLVPMFENLFLRPQLSVPVGTTVTWVNWDVQQHDVVERTALLFISPIFGLGEAWQLTFDTPGAYQYVCDLHANMEGVVLVGDSAMPASLPATDPYGY